MEQAKSRLLWLLPERQNATVVCSFGLEVLFDLRCKRGRIPSFLFSLLFFCVFFQIIGRVNADPDYLPRAVDFGLNVSGFLEHYCPPDCPTAFFPVAAVCCDLDADKRSDITCNKDDPRKMRCFPHLMRRIRVMHQHKLDPNTPPLSRLITQLCSCLVLLMFFEYNDTQ